MPTTYDTNSAIAALVELPIAAEEACLEQPLYQIYNVPLKRDVEDEKDHREFNLIAKRLIDTLPYGTCR